MQPTDTLGKEFMDLESRYWSAMRKKDSSTAVSLSDDPCVIVGAQGVGEIDKAGLARLLEGAPYNLNQFELDDVHVRQVTGDVVIVAYKVKEQLVIDGEDVALEAFDSSVWIRRDGKWACALHTESIAGDPFGRH